MFLFAKHTLHNCDFFSAKSCLNARFKQLHAYILLKTHLSNLSNCMYDFFLKRILATFSEKNHNYATCVQHTTCSQLCNMYLANKKRL